MKSILNQKKKGVMGLDTAKAFIISLMVLLIVGVLTSLVLHQLGNTSTIASDNDSQNIISNGTSGLSSFFSNTGTWLTLLGIVILVMIIFVVIRVVGGASGSNRSSL